MQCLKHLFKKMDPSVMKVHSQSHGDVQLAFKYDHTQQILLVKVMKARQLIAKDLRGKTADPYVKLWIHPDPHERGVCMTQVVKKSLNPSYHEIFTFPITTEDLHRGSLICQVWDKDLMDRDDFIGESIVNLAALDFSSQTLQMGWYSLHNETDLQISGEIEVTLQFVAPSTVHVTLHKAWGLTDRYQDQKPNPFVKIQIPGIPFCFQTKVAEESLDPEWEETFEFPLSPDEFDDKYIVIHVIDKQEEGSNESLGQVIIELGNFNPQTGYHGNFELADLKNTDRLRSKWFQHSTVQEFRESLLAHALFRSPKFLFQDHQGTKVVKVTSRKARATAQLRMINGIPVY